MIVPAVAQQGDSSKRESIEGREMTKRFNTAQGVATGAAFGLAAWAGLVYAAFGLIS